MANPMRTDQAMQMKDKTSKVDAKSSKPIPASKLPVPQPMAKRARVGQF